MKMNSILHHNVCPKHSSRQTVWQACFMLGAYRLIATKRNGGGLKEAVVR